LHKNFQALKKITSLFLAVCCFATTAFAQPKPVKIVKNASLFTYEVYDYGETIDTSLMKIVLNYPEYQIQSEEGKGPFVPGYAHETTIVNLALDSTFQLAKFTDTEQADCYEVVSAFSRSDIVFDTAQVNGLTRYTCHINSNTLEFFVQDYPYDINPLPYYGRFKGIVVCFKRNNQTYLQLAKTEFWKQAGVKSFRDGYINCQRVTGRELSQIKKQKLIITTRIFDDEQICWGKTNDHIEGDYRVNTPFDSVLHFAGGTLILKKKSLPVLPRHYQTFVELHQRSNGDAYDRTGSVFVIPQGYFGQTFFDGINNHPDSLPIITGKDGQKYQGIAFKRWVEGEWVLYYQPPVELMRFFTPFGVGHFNDRVRLDGLEWEDETYYKQEVTDLSGYLQGEDVLIGVWIGNYDGGGHKVTLDIKSYPGSDLWDDSSWEGDDEICKSLFNTCNVLEMAGQNYGKIFGTDSLSATVYIPEAKSVKLRYISTGHGGWDGGDEFTPKANTILIDGKPAFTYTPWRCDCGRYREWNPVSGNFWNGMSSSDYSRSGWCPGTATQPVYFDLSYLEPGLHTITIAIPQGEPLGGSFSHWSVSGVLLIEH
jgi:hypothetical protein